MCFAPLGEGLSCDSEAFGPAVPHDSPRHHAMQDETHTEVREDAEDAKSIDEHGGFFHGLVPEALDDFGRGRLEDHPQVHSLRGVEGEEIGIHRGHVQYLVDELHDFPNEAEDSRPEIRNLVLRKFPVGTGGPSYRSGWTPRSL